MIDHITFGVSNFALAIEFYDKTFAPLKAKRLVNITASAGDGADVAGYGDTRPEFWIAATNPTQGELHVAINVETRSLVDHFHTAALRAGGKDNDSPGLRAHYHPNYYGAFILDLDGCNICLPHP